MRKLIVFGCGLLLIPLLLYPELFAVEEKENGLVYPGGQSEWAKETLDRMTVDEKIGQLFMVAAYSNKGQAHQEEIKELITNYRIGGLIFMQGTVDEQVRLVNTYQATSKIPLLISQDAEWGLSMRLTDGQQFPRNMTLGAITEDSLLYQLGIEIGRQCSRIGVHMNFAPVVDVNNNPQNPVINDRSYGENQYRVADKGIEFMRGMLSTGVLPCAKHFPGHGDTDTDSHLDLPVIKHKRKRLDSLELYPFKRMIEAGVPSVMVAHLYVPALDRTENQASTLSPKIITELLKKKLGFNGLIVTDALNMQGVTKYYSPGEADLKALLAGNDVLLFSQDVGKAVDMIKKAIDSGKLSLEDLDRHVYKILVAKEWVNLSEDRYVKPLERGEPLYDLNSESLKKKLYQAAITVPKNSRNALPLQYLESRKIALVKLGGADNSVFERTLKKYAPITSFYMPPVSDKYHRIAVLNELKGFNTIVLAIDGMNKYANRNFGISTSARNFLNTLTQSQPNIILTLFGSPYALKFFGEEESIVVAYEGDSLAQEAAAEAIFGGIGVSGRLPVTASDEFKEGAGISYPANGVISFGIPEDVGMDSETLLKIDSIAERAITLRATPGCAVMAVRKNKVVFAKGYGQFEYSESSPIDPYESVYDLASVTKTTATTVAVMKLWQEGKIDINESISVYLPELRGTDKALILIKNILMHNAGLRSWIPFYESTFDTLNPHLLSGEIYKNKGDERFCVPIVDSLYMCLDYQDSIWLQIKNSPIRTSHKMVYSDLGMIILGKLIEKVSGVTLDHYVDSVFYAPLGMNNTTFKPYEKGISERCPPTEWDTYWRDVKVKGYVHDMACSMLGGVCGHAGLFSNTYDLAKMYTMLKNGGSYGGRRYLDSNVINYFNQRPLPGSRRGYGFDKPEPDSLKSSACSRSASDNTFGHTGFTGICVWADPDKDLVFIFLSNRTFPSMNNRKLIQYNVRTAIQSAFYESIDVFEQKNQVVDSPSG